MGGAACEHRLRPTNNHSATYYGAAQHRQVRLRSGEGWGLLGLEEFFEFAAHYRWVSVNAGPVPDADDALVDQHAKWSGSEVRARIGSGSELMGRVWGVELVEDAIEVLAGELP